MITIQLFAIFQYFCRNHFLQSAYQNTVDGKIADKDENDKRHIQPWFK